MVDSDRDCSSDGDNGGGDGGSHSDCCGRYPKVTAVVVVVEVCCSGSVSNSGCGGQ